MELPPVPLVDKLVKGLFEIGQRTGIVLHHTCS